MQPYEMIAQLRDMAAQILTPSSKGKRFFNAVADELERKASESMQRESVLREFVGECAMDRDDRISPGMKRKANEIIDSLYPRQPALGTCAHCGHRYPIDQVDAQSQCEKCGNDIL